MTPNEILDATIEILNTKIWVNHLPDPNKNETCLYLALCAAHRVHYITDPSSSLAIAYRRVIQKSGMRNLVTWNDQPHRTKQQVIELLKQAKE